MVSRGQLVEIAQRHDTAMALAMCRALGVEPRRRGTSPPAKVKAPRHRRCRYKGWRSTMRQMHGVRQDLGS